MECPEQWPQLHALLWHKRSIIVFIKVMVLGTWRLIIKGRILETWRAKVGSCLMEGYTIVQKAVCCADMLRLA